MCICYRGEARDCGPRTMRWMLLWSYELVYDDAGVVAAVIGIALLSPRNQAIGSLPHHAVVMASAGKLVAAMLRQPAIVNVKQSR